MKIRQYLNFRSIWGYSSVGQNVCPASRRSWVQVPLSPPFFALIAQSVERLTVNQRVTGSNPVQGAMRVQLSWLEHQSYKLGVQGSSPCTRTINKTFIIYLFINNRRYSAKVIILFGGFYRVLKSPSFLGTWSSLVMALALGARNREFESLSPDHKKYNLKIFDIIYI